ncbi:methylthioribulose 1-phosphate dehydratase [Spirulina subsalsa]|uniref:methylthioribulose 1-phosphate dehydratase n=1 Tax=Spirulina subsalsa TaxID=54311 RepID=UPI00031E0E5A|nr:methylthioribulose 1-phosphate dehydratase [Spirulina subsalsa]
MTTTATVRADLVASAQQFYQLGWMLGTAGNLSAKNPDGSFWITASGKSKGRLTEQDFVRLSPHGQVLETPLPENRPSAETSIHQAIYDLFPEAQACYHVHSVEANLVTQFCEGDCLSLPPLEMIKGLGIWEENPHVSMPVFENYLDVPKIAQALRDRFSQSCPEVPALLIRHHGVTVWGTSPTEAHNRVEIAEYLFRYIVALG